MLDTIAKIIDVVPKKFLVWAVFLLLFLLNLVDSSQITTVTVTYITANIVAKYTPKAKAIADKLK